MEVEEFLGSGGMPSVRRRLLPRCAHPPLTAPPLYASAADCSCSCSSSTSSAAYCSTVVAVVLQVIAVDGPIFSADFSVVFYKELLWYFTDTVIFKCYITCDGFKTQVFPLSYHLKNPNP